MIGTGRRNGNADAVAILDPGVVHGDLLPLDLHGIVQRISPDRLSRPA